MKINKITSSEIGFLFEFIQRVSFLKRIDVRYSELKEILNEAKKILLHIKRNDIFLYILCEFFINDSKYYNQQLFDKLELNKNKINFLYFDNIISPILLEFIGYKSNINEKFDVFIKNNFKNIDLEKISFLRKQGEVSHCDFLIDYSFSKGVGKKRKKERKLFVLDYSEYIGFLELVINSVIDSISSKDNTNSLKEYKKLKKNIAFLFLKNRIDKLSNKINNETIFYDIQTKMENDFEFFIDKISKSHYKKDVYFILKQFNKNIAKIIQSGSYAYSYCSNFDIKFDEICLASKSSISDDEIIFTKEQNYMNLLKKCNFIYKDSKSTEDNLSVLFKLIANQFEGKVFNFESLQKLYFEKFIPFFKNNDILSQDENIKFTIKKGEFTPLNMEFRKKHSKIIKSAIKQSKILFLTGNPGSGKTYTPLRLDSDTSSVFFYFSSRTAINQSLKKEILEDASNEINKKTIVFSITNDNLNFEFENMKKHYINTDISDNEDKEKIFNFFNNKSKNNDFTFISTKDLENIKLKTSTKKSYRKTDIITNEGKELTKIQHSSTSVYQALRYTFKTIKEFNQKEEFKEYKCFIVGTIQGYEHNIDNYTKMFQEILNDKKEHILMFDEIMGTSLNFEIIKKILKIAHSKQNSILIFSDANLKNRDSIELLLQEEKNENKILITENKKEEDISIKKLIYDNKECVVIEASAFPAKNININFDLMLRKTRKKVISKKSINEELIDKIIKMINENLNNNEKTFIYIQDKNFIEKLNKKLKNIRTILLTSDTTKDSKITKKINSREYDCVIATSSASRGLSFKDIHKFIILFQNFNITDGLNELSQVIYRGRGFDDKNKLNNDDASDKDFTIIFREIIDENELFSGLNSNFSQYFINKKFIEITGKILFTTHIFYVFSNYKNISKFFIPIPSSSKVMHFNSYFNKIKELEKIKEKIKFSIEKRELEDFMLVLNKILYIFYNNISKTIFNTKKIENKLKYLNGFIIKEAELDYQDIYHNKNNYQLSILIKSLKEEAQKSKKILDKIDKSIFNNLKNIEDYFDGLNSKRVVEKLKVYIISEAFLSKEPINLNIKSKEHFEEVEIDFDILKEVEEQTKDEVLEIFSKTYIRLISSMFLINKDVIYSDYGLKLKDKSIIKTSITIIPKIDINNNNKTFNYLTAMLGLYI